MKEVLFSSMDGGVSHRIQILKQLSYVRDIAMAVNDPVDVQIMVFAFTTSKSPRRSNRWSGNAPVSVFA
ncbi:hypothetical protein [Pseudorhodobacter sp.]|uniref:hypothetical protein n=1 Tax=Pseudorhodobacter sp. TaxID=1934400 RepID=UPI0026499D07|nr:hypothetical protein [Pseudorhodobacter sp.]MDN5786364.1 hypothetical protein [Pseudorhodobacter sp.]